MIFTVINKLFSRVFLLIIIAIFLQGCLKESKSSKKVVDQDNVVASSSTKAEAGNGQALVSFETSKLSGEKQNQKTALYTVTSKPDNKTASGSESPILVTGLKNGTAYKFTLVSSLNPGVVIAIPNVVIPTANAKTVSSAPAISSVTPGDARAIINFKAPATDGGSPITFYTVTSAPDNLYATGFTSPLVVSGLTNGKNYTFKVTATNAIGTSEVSVASNIVVPTAPASIPGAPIIGTATAGNASAKVSFLAPATNGGSVVTSYTVTSNPGNFSAVGSVSPIEVKGLTNGAAYTFKVVAANAIGSGVFSNSSNSVTPFVPASIPGTPTIGVASAGNASASVNFTPPASNGGSAITSYTVTSNPGNIIKIGSVSPVLVSGLTNSTAYTFKVSATNALGTGGASASSNSVIPLATVTLPGSPIIGVVVPGNASASINFSAPASNGGAAISNYIVTSNPGNIVANGATSPIVMSGLTNGTSYTFNVKATNSAGTGMASATSASIIPVAPVIISGSTVPGAPSIGVAVGENAAATINFTAPTSNGGSAITNYTVTSNPGNITKSGTASPIIVTGLTNGTAYTFTVKASNAIGVGAASSATNSITPLAPATAPGAPTIGVATAGNASAIVNFTAPTSNGGATITGYSVTSNPGNIIVTGASSPITVSGLTNGLAYTFSVKATNSVGTGSTSISSNSITPSLSATSPGIPTIGIAVAGNNSATVNFTAPASNGGAAISNYTVVSNPGNLSGTGTASPVIVNGLTNDVAYTFSVKATNSIGSSAFSAATNSVTPIAPLTGTTVPNAPVMGLAVAGNTAVTLNFTRPVSDGGSPITNYNVSVSPGSMSLNGNINPFIVSGLTNGTAYTFTIRAQNAKGYSVFSAVSNSVTPTIPAPSLTAPSAPTITSVTAGVSSATINFQPPSSNGGSPITSYSVTSNPGNIIVNGVSSPIIVNGLTNGTAYNFTIKASNSIGTSLASAQSANVTPSGPMTVPSAPVMGAVTLSENIATINFTTPASDGGLKIDYYQISGFENGVLFKEYIFVTIPFRTESLKSDKSYTFKVKAHNSLGFSPISALSNAVTPGQTKLPPSAPFLSEVKPGDSKAMIYFDAGTRDGGSPITSYTAISSSGRTQEGTSSPITMSNLLNGKDYQFYIKANNAIGSSPSSNGSLLISPGFVGGIVPPIASGGNFPLNGLKSQATIFWPGGAAIDSSGAIYVADKLSHRIQKYKNDGSYIGQISSYGRGEGQLRSPEGIAIDASGNIYIVDAGNSRIVKFNSEAVFQKSFGSSGDKDGQFNFLCDGSIAVDKSNNVYVTDCGNSRVQKFSSEGVFITKFGSKGSGNGEFANPAGIAINALGNILVSDRDNMRLVKFSNQGEFMSNLNLGTLTPNHLSIDPNGNFTVDDFYRADISRFDSNGNFLNQIKISQTKAMAVDSTGNIYISDFSAIPLVKLSPAGVRDANFGIKLSSNEFKLNKMIKIDSADKLYVLDSVDPVIFIYDHSGNLLSSLKIQNTAKSRKYASGMTVDLAGNIYVSINEGSNYCNANALRSVHKYNSKGEFLFEFATGGCTNDGGINYGNEALTHDTAGNIYLSANDTITKYNSSGVQQMKFGSNGHGDAQFDGIGDVAVNSNGDIFVSDYRNFSIKKFSSEGKFLLKMGSSRFDSPDYLYGNIMLSIDTNNKLFAITSGAILKLNTSLEIESSFQAPPQRYGPDSWQDLPLGLAVDKAGNIYVGDTNNYRVMKFDSSGKALKN